MRAERSETDPAGDSRSDTIDPVQRGLVSKAARALRGRPAPAAQAPVELTEVQERALSSLRETGIAIVPFVELTGDAALWESLQAEMETFVQSAVGELEQDVQAKRKKEFLIRRFPRGKSKMPLEPAVLPTDGPWLRFAAGDALLDIVNAYRDTKTKLVDFDQWYTLPVGEDHERVASQQWHRDPEDQHVVKVFLYFSDVDEDAGPFEYALRSAEGGKYGHLWPWGKGATRYPPSDELEQLIPASDRVLATGPAGTLVICDTSGFHRGGYGKAKPRILSTHTYVNRKITPDKPDRRKFQVEWGENDLSEQARFALT
jgi:hypothetical protein